MSSSPDATILSAFQELVDAYSEEEYSVAVEKCSFLLKKKSALNASLTSSVQRLLLQSYLQQKSYAKVLEWCSQYNLHKDLKFYAQYRLEDYDQVAKQATKDSVLEQHLLAQSQFHLQQATPALKVYQELLLQHADTTTTSSTMEKEETQMELYTNVLAVLTSAAAPFVPLLLEKNDDWIDKAETFLEAHPQYSDLALNLGTLQFLTEPWNNDTTSENNTNWLEHAQTQCEDPADLVPIELNLAWSCHFWNAHLEEDIHYNTSDGTAPQVAIAKLNQSLLASTSQQKQQPIPSQPHPKWNSLQLRMYWYNRAVTQYKSNQWVECHESCQSLRKTLNSSSNKKKKNKQTTTPVELWWESRVDVILAHVMQQQSKTTSSSQANSKLEQRLENLQKEKSSPTIDHAMAHVQLHLHSLKHNPSSNSNNKEETTRALLKSLPASIQSRPAVVATLQALEEEDTATTLKKQQQKTTRTATTTTPDALFGQGKFKEAAQLYQQQQLPDPSKCDPDQLAQHLRLVQCLAATDQHEQASQLWESLQPYLEGSVESSVDDGEALEQQALPRSSTTTTMAAVQESSSKPKRSHDSVLRERARKREAYLQELEAKGQFNPDRPTKPNSERWIPKHERSRARGRGRNQQQNRSAQGGGSQADSQRLDAAARRAGTVPASSGPSTANLQVSSGGRKGGRRR